jgi:hypothetical protein
MRDILWDGKGRPSALCFEGEIVRPGDFVPHPTDDRYREEHGMAWVEEPLALFRSVSDAEIYSIWSNGMVLGGGNGFNEFDPRPFVMFGDRVTSLLVWQGEDRERCAIRRCLGMYADVDDGLRAEAAAIRLGQKAWMDRYNAAGTHQIAKLEEALHFRRDREWERLRAKERAFDGRFSAIRKQFRWNVRQEEESIARDLEGKPWTSVILETHPLAGCRAYRGSFSRDEVEYGFLPGQVGWDDVAAFHLVRDRKIVGTVEPRLMEELLAEWEFVDASRIGPPGEAIPAELRAEAPAPAPTMR